VIVGGGPAGATAAIVLARQGVSGCLLEKARHPRFHIGEAILPRTNPLLTELGVEDEMKKISHLLKLGAEFGFGDNFKEMNFFSSDGLLPGNPIFNVERSIFDKMLIDNAAKAGATVLQETAVKGITRLDEGSVEVETADQKFSGSILVDASGHGTIVGRHL